VFARPAFDPTLHRPMELPSLDHILEPSVRVHPTQTTVHGSVTREDVAKSIRGKCPRGRSLRRGGDRGGTNEMVVKDAVGLEPVVVIGVGDDEADIPDRLPGRPDRVGRTPGPIPPGGKLSSTGKIVQTLADELDREAACYRAREVRLHRLGDLLPDDHDSSPESGTPSIREREVQERGPSRAHGIELLEAAVARPQTRGEDNEVHVGRGGASSRHGPERKDSTCFVREGLHIAFRDAPEEREGIMIATRPAIVAILIALSACAGEGGEGGEGDEGMVPQEEGITLSGVGFSTPEAVLHDSVADVYLVSNISGDPLGADGDGFVSRVSPEGEILDLRWIDGTADGVELNAPKGMEIFGDSLYVADIDCVRIFVRTTGAPSGEICIQGAMLLNDIAVDSNGTLYVTDTGLEAGPEGLAPTDNSAIYRFFPDGRTARIASGPELGNPNGIAVGSRGIFAVTFGSGEVYQLNPENGTRTHVLDDPQLDGIEFVGAGGFLYSSWGASAIYQVTPTGQKVTVVEGVDAPASIGYDASRGRVLIPLFNLNEVWVRDVPGADAP